MPLAGCGQYVYDPDLVHLGASTPLLTGGSATFQARCLTAAPRKLGVGKRCTTVGLGYGRFLAFETGHGMDGVARRFSLRSPRLGRTEAAGTWEEAAL